MPQFTVYRNPNPASRRRVPLLLDVQSGLLDDLATRVVVPLVPASQRKAQSVKKLMPTVVVDGERYLLVTPQLAGVSRKSLGAAVGDLSGHRAEIVAALDLLLTGV